MTLRSLDLMPAVAVASFGRISTVLTIIAMAALGLGVDARVLGAAGGRVIAAAVMSLVVLGAISLLLIHALGMS
ncbi:putative sulfate exporter family transporter, partial [Stenotrophomonas maltophilia]|uniref:putative sulfate exporter family transporter n=2 Tax=Gammaproteobacteria TaxID=1236 RepID=UPI0013DBD9E6